jgi:hypothetical protein
MWIKESSITMCIDEGSITAGMRLMKRFTETDMDGRSLNLETQKRCCAEVNPWVWLIRHHMR